MAKKCVFAKTEILSSLKVLESEYQKAYVIASPQNTRLMKAYSKISVITLGGWIEDGMKDLTDISTDNISNPDNQNKLSYMLGKINGFNYHHVSKKIIYTFGVHGLEFIENKVGSADMARLSSSLNNLKAWRNPASHSHVVTIPCDPSRIIIELNRIFPILKNMEKSARLYRDVHFR